MSQAQITMSLPTVRDSDAELLVTSILALGQPSLRDRGVEGARTYLEQRAGSAPAGPDVAQVEDGVVLAGEQRVPVRVYRGTPSEDLPVVV